MRVKPNFDPWGVRMKKRATLFLLLALFLLFGTVNVLAQEKSAIAVKGSELNNGVVIVNVLKGGKAYELQCNQGAPDCTPLKSGKYQMVELPKNYGMYDCRDVEVYSDSGTAPETNKKLGEYCLLEK